QGQGQGQGERGKTPRPSRHDAISAVTPARKRYARARKAAPRPRRVARDLSVPLDRLSWRVGHDEQSDRLDQFLLTRMPWRSRAQMHALIAEGRVTRNGEAATRKAGRV